MIRKSRFVDLSMQVSIKSKRPELSSWSIRTGISADWVLTVNICSEMKPSLESRVGRPVSM
jgi:hypothetical protein